ncbi:hypothetical protein [Scytonema sp. PRP1]|uniref:hypothetical protein n=1 Tax=Scytonema sp. PRP1 TaxID=3120513 RepID=UPI002FD0B5EB
MHDTNESNKPVQECDCAERSAQRGIPVSPADRLSRREACPTGQGEALPIACFQCFTVVYGKIVVVRAIASKRRALCAIAII